MFDLLEMEGNKTVYTYATQHLFDLLEMEGNKFV